MYILSSILIFAILSPFWLMGFIYELIKASFRIGRDDADKFAGFMMDKGKN